MAKEVPPGVAMRIEFIHEGVVVTRFPVTIRTARDLYSGMQRAYRRLRQEHPRLDMLDVEIFLRRDN